MSKVNIIMEYSHLTRINGRFLRAFLVLPTVSLGDCKIQKAYIIAVEQEVRERIRKLSSLRDIQKVDITDLAGLSDSDDSSTPQKRPQSGHSPGSVNNDNRRRPTNLPEVNLPEVNRASNDSQMHPMLNGRVRSVVKNNLNGKDRRAGHGKLKSLRDQDLDALTPNDILDKAWDHAYISEEINLESLLDFSDDDLISTPDEGNGYRAVPCVSPDDDRDAPRERESFFEISDSDFSPDETKCLIDDVTSPDDQLSDVNVCENLESDSESVTPRDSFIEQLDDSADITGSDVSDSIGDMHHTKSVLSAIPSTETQCNVTTSTVPPSGDDRALMATSPLSVPRVDIPAIKQSPERSGKGRDKNSHRFSREMRLEPNKEVCKPTNLTSDKSQHIIQVVKCTVPVISTDGGDSVVQTSGETARKDQPTSDPFSSWETTNLDMSRAVNEDKDSSECGETTNGLSKSERNTPRQREVFTPVDEEETFPWAGDLELLQMSLAQTTNISSGERKGSSGSTKWSPADDKTSRDSSDTSVDERTFSRESNILLKGTLNVADYRQFYEQETWGAEVKDQRSASVQGKPTAQTVTKSSIKRRAFSNEERISPLVFSLPASCATSSDGDLVSARNKISSSATQQPSSKRRHKSTDALFLNTSVAFSGESISDDISDSPCMCMCGETPSDSEIDSANLIAYRLRDNLKSQQSPAAISEDSVFVYPYSSEREGTAESETAAEIRALELG